MSGPYENPQLLDDVCRAVMREKETATGCLLVIFYGDLAELITGERDMTRNLADVVAKLRTAADKLEALHAEEQNETK